MERNTSRANWGRTESSRGPSAPTRSGRLGAVPAVAATIALIVLGGGLFGLMSQRSAAPRVGSQPSTTGTRVRQNGPTVNLPANSTLDGVSMDSPTDGWAVGTVYNQSNGMGDSQNVLLAHYDGKSWTASPNSANFKVGYLIGVSMDSADDGWAVGSTQDSPGAPLRGLLLHYTGGHWQAVGISSTGYAGGGTIHMVSADEGWLYAPIGAKTSPDHKTLLLHYQGGTWHLVSSLPGDVLFSMLSATDGWAADIETDAIYHYQKGNWTQVASATGQPLVMAMVSSSEGWIAGSEAGTGSGKSAFVMRYDGQSWTPMALPSASDAEVDQITVAAPGDIWLIGQVHTSTMAPTAVAWHYSSGTWTLVNLNLAAFPTGAAMASPTSGWVTGNALNNTAALAEFAQGQWSAVYYGK